MKDSSNYLNQLSKFPRFKELTWWFDTKKEILFTEGIATFATLYIITILLANEHCLSPA